MRSALLGAVVAITVIVTSLTFASSLNALVSQPPLYGWNWDYALPAGFSAAENLPAAETTALLDHDPDVAHWAGVYFETANLDGQSVPVLAMRPGAGVSPSLLTGHALDEPSQIVLGTGDPGVAACTRRRHGRRRDGRSHESPPAHRRDGDPADHRRVG